MAPSVPYLDGRRFVQLTGTDGSALGNGDSTPLIVRGPAYTIGALGILKAVDESPALHLSFLYNINTQLVTTTTANGGTVTQAASHAVLATSTASNGSARLESSEAIKYTPGQGVIARFTAVFNAGVANSQQEVGLGDSTDGFFFGYVGATFGIIHRNGGVDTFIAQSTWNGDKLNGSGPSRMTLDPTKGNLYSVQIQWLGYGVVRFFIEDQTTGNPILVHSRLRANTATTVSLTNPTLPLHARVFNTGNTSNVVLRTPSMGVFREGAVAHYGARGATNNRKTGVTTEICLLSIKNKGTYASVPNKIQVRLDHTSLSASVECVFRFVLNATIGGTPAFTDFDTNTSPMQFDVAGTTRTGGRVFLIFVVENGNGVSQNISEFEQWLHPNDTLTITATSNAGNAAASAAICWFEEF